MSNTWALVPLKNLDRAKQRLVPALSEDQRRNLVLAMARDVLTALEKSASITKTLLVSSEPEGRRYGQVHGQQGRVFQASVVQHCCEVRPQRFGG